MTKVQPNCPFLQNFRVYFWHSVTYFGCNGNCVTEKFEYLDCGKDANCTRFHWSNVCLNLEEKLGCWILGRFPTSVQQKSRHFCQFGKTVDHLVYFWYPYVHLKTFVFEVAAIFIKGPCSKLMWRYHPGQSTFSETALTDSFYFRLSAANSIFTLIKSVKVKLCFLLMSYLEVQ